MTKPSFTMPFYHSMMESPISGTPFIPLTVTSGLFSQIKLEKDIAMNTATSHMLIPQTAPELVTQSVPQELYFRIPSSPVKEPSSLMMKPYARPPCVVSIFHSNKPILKQAGPCRYILSTHSTQIRKNCAGKPERMQILKQVVFYIKLNNSCTVKTENWTIKGIYHIQEIKHISIRPFVTDLTSPLLDQIPQLPLNCIQTLPKWTTINHLLALNISKQEPLLYMSYVQKSPSDTGYHSWINTSTVIIIVCVSILFCICWRCVIP